MDTKFFIQTANVLTLKKVFLLSLKNFNIEHDPVVLYQKPLDDIAALLIEQNINHISEIKTDYKLFINFFFKNLTDNLYDYFQDFIQEQTFKFLNGFFITSVNSLGVFKINQNGDMEFTNYNEMSTDDLAVIYDVISYFVKLFK